MSRASPDVSRRAFLAMLGAASALGPRFAGAAPGPILKKAIPSTGEQVPVIGMGSWMTFNVGEDKELRDQRLQVLQTFFDRGGAVIDSSPMYGTSEEVIGHCLERIGDPGRVFSATKVWTPLKWFGPGQMEESRELWGVERFDLMQIMPRTSPDRAAVRIVNPSARASMPDRFASSAMRAGAWRQSRAAWCLTARTLDGLGSR